MRSPKDARVVHEHVEASVGVDGLLDHRLGRGEVAHVVAVGDGLAARRLDLLDDFVGRAQIGSDAVSGATEIVHDDLRAMGGQHQGVLATDAAAGAGHDANAVFAEVGHGTLLVGGETDARAARGLLPSP